MTKQEMITLLMTELEVDAKACGKYTALGDQKKADLFRHERDTLEHVLYLLKLKSIDEDYDEIHAIADRAWEQGYEQGVKEKELKDKGLDEFIYR